MIKTVSFAAPRAARAVKTAGKTPTSKAPTVKVPSKSVASRAATVVPAKSSPARIADDAAEPVDAAPKPRVAPKKEREAVKVPATMTAADARAALQKNATSTKKPRATKTASAKEAVVPIAQPAAQNTPAKRTPRKAEDTLLESTVVAPPVKAKATTIKAEVAEVAEVETATKRSRAPKVTAETEAESAVVAPALQELSEAKTALKTKRSRVPKDLAAQYGGASETEDVPRHAAPTAAPRKRLTRAKKEARTQLLQPDDDVLQRLQQANAVEVKKPARRGRGWEFECGRCGRVTHFSTPGALCECGAIAVRE